ncbi:MAG: DUF2807 domain-containing protein [Planctomycetota bacterium]
MKNLFVAVVAALTISIAGCNISFNGSSSGVAGSGTKKSEDREVTEFTRIVIEGVGEVEISIAEEASLSIATDDNILELIESTVEDGVLKIRPTESINPTIGPEITIATLALEGVTVDGAAALDITGDLGESLDIVLNGAGNVEGNGSVNDLNIETNGAGNVDLEELEADSVKIVLNGAGNGTVHANSSVDATINGFGSVTVHGNPADVNRSVNGLGSVSIVEHQPESDEETEGDDN